MAEEVAIVYTDGSCIGNGKPNAIGGFGVYFVGGTAPDIAEALTRENNDNDAVTNNKAELRAVLAALLALRDSSRSVLIHTDSMDWAKYWSKPTLDLSRPIPERFQNRNILGDIREVYSQYYAPKGRTVKTVHVKAHTGNEDTLSVGNDIADTLANLGTAKAAVEQGLHKKWKVKAGRFAGMTYQDAFDSDPGYHQNSPTPRSHKLTYMIFQVLRTLQEVQM